MKIFVITLILIALSVIIGLMLNRPKIEIENKDVCKNCKKERTNKKQCEHCGYWR